MKKTTEDLKEDALLAFTIASTVLGAIVISGLGISLWTWFGIASVWAAWAWWKFWKATA